MGEGDEGVAEDGNVEEGGPSQPDPGRGRKKFW